MSAATFVRFRVRFRVVVGVIVIVRVRVRVRARARVGDFLVFRFTLAFFVVLDTVYDDFLCVHYIKDT